MKRAREGDDDNCENEDLQNNFQVCIFLIGHLGTAYNTTVHTNLTFSLSIFLSFFLSFFLSISFPFFLSLLLSHRPEIILHHLHLSLCFSFSIARIYLSSIIQTLLIKPYTILHGVLL